MKRNDRPRRLRDVCLAFALTASCLLVPAQPAQAVTAQGWVPYTMTPPLNSSQANLTAIAAVSATNVWAVGWALTSVNFEALVEHWDGTTWTQEALPAHNQGVLLTGVSVSGANSVWAVGSESASNGLPSPFVEHWNGTAWGTAKVSVPFYGHLTSVAAISKTNVWAVGGYLDPGTGDRALIAHWDGTSWTQVPGAALSGVGDELDGIAAVSASDVWAVGHTMVNGSQGQTLIEHWDGTAWSAVGAPTDGSLKAITAIGPNDMWAVGTASTTFPSPLAEHWDGATWSVVATPPSRVVAGSQSQDSLYSVSGSGPDDVWAVGGGVGDFQSLVDHWDGTTWKTVRSPNLSPGQSTGDTLAGVVAISPTDAWAVGNSDFRNIAVDRYAQGAFTSALSIGSTTSYPAVDQPLSIWVQLSLSYGDGPHGETIHITRTNPDGTKTVLSDVITDDGGVATLTDIPVAYGNFTYTATFDGDSALGGSQASFNLSLAGLVASLHLSFSASHNPIRYMDSVSVQVTLSKPQATTDLAVTLTVTPIGQPPIVVPLTLDPSSLSATTHLRLDRDTSFSATWQGDAQFSPAQSPTAGVNVQAGVSGKLLHRYGTSGGYALYHHRKRIVFRGDVAPNHVGETLVFALDVQVRHHWYLLGTAQGILDANSEASVRVVGFKRGTYRISCRIGTDGTNLGARSAWALFKITA